MSVTANTHSAKQTVVSLIDSLNKEDFKAARRYAADDMTFDGVLGSRRGADSYFADMEKMRLKYDIKKVFVDGNDVCIFSEMPMQGSNIFVCAWYHVEDDKVSSLRVVFDPRPVLANKAA